MVKVLFSLGFLINHKKSVLAPIQDLVWLGVRLDATVPQMALPEAEAALLAEKARAVLVKGAASRREVESLVGSMNFVSHWHREAKWRKHLFQPLVGRFPIRDRDEARVLPEEFPKDLRWWTNKVHTAKWSPLRPPTESVRVWTYASDSG